MPTQQVSVNPSSPKVRWPRFVIGYVLGSFAGGLIGWLIDRAITADPYVGVRIGLFIGGLCGGMIGAGTGWTGVTAILFMVLCSAAGALGSLAIWNPAPDNFASFIPLMAGGIIGAFVGLVIAASVIRRMRSRVPHET